MASKNSSFVLVSTPSQLPEIKYISRHPLEMELGTVIKLGSPQGHMTKEKLQCWERERSETLEPILIAGGTGISPFMSLAQDSCQRKSCLYWSYRHEEDQRLIQRYLPSKSSIRIHQHRYHGQAHELEEFKQSLVIDTQRPYFLAGPYNFVQLIGDYLLSQGITMIESDMKKFSISVPE